MIDQNMPATWGLALLGLDELSINICNQRKIKQLYYGTYQSLY